MKKIISFTVALMLSFSLIAQPATSADIFYLQKSKNQKTAAYITLGCAAATLVPGIIMLSQTQPGWEHVDWNKALGGTGLTFVGAGFAAASIILFIASKRNETMANRLSISINKPIQVNTGLFVKNLPYSVGISFDFL